MHQFKLMLLANLALAPPPPNLNGVRGPFTPVSMGSSSETSEIVSCDLTPAIRFFQVVQSTSARVREQEKRSEEWTVVYT